MASIRGEIDACFSKAMDAADAYADDNRVIGNTLLGNARSHSGRVDEALSALVQRASAAAAGERRFVAERADAAAATAFYVVGTGA